MQFAQHGGFSETVKVLELQSEANIENMGLSGKKTKDAPVTTTVKTAESPDIIVPLSSPTPGLGKILISGASTGLASQKSISSKDVTTTPTVTKTAKLSRKKINTPSPDSTHYGSSHDWGKSETIVISMGRASQRAKDVPTTTTSAKPSSPAGSEIGHPPSPVQPSPLPPRSPHAKSQHLSAYASTALHTGNQIKHNYTCT